MVRYACIDWRTVAMVAASAITLALMLGRWPDTTDRLVLGIYLAALMVLAAIDLDQKLLPDVITLPLIPFALLAVVVGIDPLLAGKDFALGSAIAAGIGAPVLLLLTDRLFGGGLGMGDVKLSVSLGLMLGVSRLLAGFLLASIAGARGARRAHRGSSPEPPSRQSRSGPSSSPQGSSAHCAVARRWCAFATSAPSAYAPLDSHHFGRRALSRGWCNRRSRE